MMNASSRRTALFALVSASLLSGSSVDAFHGRLIVHVGGIHQGFASSFLGGSSIDVGIGPSSSSRSATGGSHGRICLSMTVTTAELIELAVTKQTNSAPGSTGTNIRITRDVDGLRANHATEGSTARRGKGHRHGGPGDDAAERKEVSTKGANGRDNVDELAALGIHLPFGLRQQLLTNARQAIHKRFWIVDNSGSMNIMDGHQVLAEHGLSITPPPNQCTRWSEVQETVRCHAELSAALGAPTDFHLLNPRRLPSSSVGSGGFCSAGPLGLLRGQQTFRVGYGVSRTPRQVAKDCKRAQNVMLRTEPNGKTALADSIADIRREVVKLLPQLEAEGSKVCLVIATDGSNNDDRHLGGGNRDNSGLLESVHHISEEDRQRDVIAALRSLQGLPVVVVIRLCTDHQPLVDFYSACLDRAQNVGDDDGDDDGANLCRDLLEVDIDVLDDHAAEAGEVHEQNPWLNYALILHRMREMGQDHRMFDLLDERPFDRLEVHDFVCVTLFGTTSDHRWTVYDDAEWARFVDEVDSWQEKEHKQWNPITKTKAPWIDTQALLAVP